MTVPASQNAVQKEQDFIEAHLLIEDRQERLAALAAWGAQAPLLPEDLRTPQNRVPGCISRVWVDAMRSDEGLFLPRLATDSPMVGGLVGVTIRLFDALSVECAATFHPSWPAALRLDRMISPTRLEGIAAVAAWCRKTARAHVD